MSSYAQFNPSFGGAIPCLLKWLLCSPTHSASQQKSDPIQRRQTTIAGPLAVVTVFPVWGMVQLWSTMDYTRHSRDFLPTLQGDSCHR
ncbi:hypothetical protein BO79DRAFT_207426 [Aspergillus costaricaensis CBS 115574]|uniref:Uncharacterized protein n=1 Tax=Aspergillus costaricaensis CBS 115574 TaxID=1448317 RepID=A0ACD1IQC6_9EURO|nr:hypothetical protein BO79DRAFT_207426 [Aspergillus costaricaensis CBS 115574]RAK92310.1 hypothetical protein BO79DRAFT_207426 [Aspergillus costaricaensis CBS 115574]